MIDRRSQKNDQRPLECQVFYAFRLRLCCRCSIWYIHLAVAIHSIPVLKCKDLYVGEARMVHLALGFVDVQRWSLGWISTAIAQQLPFQQRPWTNVGHRFRLSWVSLIPKVLPPVWRIFAAAWRVGLRWCLSSIIHGYTTPFFLQSDESKFVRRVFFSRYFVFVY